MKNQSYTTDQLMTSCLCLSSDKRVMEKRILGIFSRKQSGIVASLAAMLLLASLVVGCFTTMPFPGEAPGSANDVSVAGQAETIITSDTDTVPFFSSIIPEETAIDVAANTATLLEQPVENLPVHTRLGHGSANEALYYNLYFGSPDEENCDIFAVINAKTGQCIQYTNHRPFRNAQQNSMEEAELSDELVADMRHTALDYAAKLMERGFSGSNVILSDLNENGLPVGSFADAIQYDESSLYLADTYIRTTEGPCYFLRVAMRQDMKEPLITMFSRYNSWEECCGWQKNTEESIPENADSALGNEDIVLTHSTMMTGRIDGQELSAEMYATLGMAATSVQWNQKLNIGPDNTDATFESFSLDFISYLLENNGMPCVTLKTDDTTSITMENYDSVLCPGMPVYCISDVDPIYAIYIGNEMLVRPSSHIQRLRTEPLHVLLSRYQTILPARLYQSSDNG